MSEATFSKIDDKQQVEGIWLGLLNWIPNWNNTPGRHYIELLAAFPGQNNESFIFDYPTEKVRVIRGFTFEAVPGASSITIKVTPAPTTTNTYFAPPDTSIVSRLIGGITSGLPSISPVPPPTSPKIEQRITTPPPPQPQPDNKDIIILVIALAALLLLITMRRR